MIKLELTIKETKETGMVEVAAEVKSNKEEATMPERVIHMLVRKLLSEPALGVGQRDTRDEAFADAMKSSEIARDIIKAGMPLRKEIPKQ